VLPLQTCDLFVVGPVRWKTQIERANWKEISGFPWVWPYAKCPFCQILEEAFHQRNLQPRKVVVADQEAAFKMLVTSGVGLTLMIAPEALAAEEEGQLIVWKKHTFQIDLSFAYLRKREQDPMLQAILNGLFIVWDITKRSVKS
jgi:DNA-binding transcriptional LysR family regulator